MKQPDNFMVKKLYALKQVGKHIGMYGPLRNIPVLTDADKLRCLLCVAMIQNDEATMIQKMASALMLEYYIPEWREVVGVEVLGNVLTRDDPEVRAWRKRVLARDKHQCIDCGSVENLEAHHIAHWADFPELRLVDENGSTLCNDCHAKQHENIKNLILSRTR